MRRARVSVHTKEARTLQESLRPETLRPLPRTRVSVQSDGHVLHLEVGARDTSSLRAALNSYLRWASTALKVIEEARS